MQRRIFDDIHDMFRDSVRRFVEKELAPSNEEWERNGIVDRWAFEKAGAQGFLAPQVPEAYGGPGTDDFRFNQIVVEELNFAGLTSASVGIGLHNDVCAPYFLELCNEEQKQRWLPGIASGELITAIAMTEPGTGSDLRGIATTARRDGDHYIVNGAKTFITNGINADLVVTAVKTDPTAGHRGVSLLVIERDNPGFKRGRKLDKVGLQSQDTAELFFEDCRVPVDNLLGEEGMGFKYLMMNLPQERLGVAVGAVAMAHAAVQWTLDYVKERTAFGQPVGQFQNTRFVLAECKTEVDVGWAYLDACVMEHNRGELSAEDAAGAKMWCSELQGRVLDKCVQMHGGYGYMREYAVARAWTDARVTRIYAGTNEIMKEIVGRSLGLGG